MAKYEILQTLPFPTQPLTLRIAKKEAFVHFDDPATAIMIDFAETPPPTIISNTTLDDARNELKRIGGYFFLVTDPNQHIIGLVSGEELWGEKPIQTIQERRIHYAQVQVHMIMKPMRELPVIDFHWVQYANVGNILNSLKAYQQPYALVVEPTDQEQQPLRGLFSLSQLSRQLHHELVLGIHQAESISELKKTHNP